MNKYCQLKFALYPKFKKPLSVCAINWLRYVSTELPGWSFWDQISEIWSQMILAGSTIFIWPFSRTRLASCKNQIWPPWVLSDKPYFFTFLTNWLQIFTKFLKFEGFQLQNCVRILRDSELIWKFSKFIQMPVTCQGSSENCYIT